MKRIVICADGTWNVRDQKVKGSKTRRPTNVTKLVRAVKPQAGDGTFQVVFYHEGVGTSGGLDKFTGGAFGEGIESNIRALYRFLVYNYQDGDELFFFGFSRGAFTVRTLTGFMNFAGLIHKDDDYWLPEIYGCYQSGQPITVFEEAHPNMRSRRVCPTIRFIGVWDTVGALGAPGLLGQIFNKNKFKYHDVTLNSHILNAYHALAIDERRKPFAPNLWTRPAGWTGALEQVWFAGVHCNVGGGYPKDGLANEALHWMVGKAEALGLEVDAAFLQHFEPHFDSVLNDSMTALYKLVGPYVRPIGKQLADGEAVHQSALDRMGLAECNYAAENLKASLASAKPVKAVTTAPNARGAAGRS